MITPIRGVVAPLTLSGNKASPQPNRVTRNTGTSTNHKYVTPNGLSSALFALGNNGSGVAESFYICAWVRWGSNSFNSIIFDSNTASANGGGVRMFQQGLGPRGAVRGATTNTVLSPSVPNVGLAAGVWMFCEFFYVPNDGIYLYTNRTNSVRSAFTEACVIGNGSQAAVFGGVAGHVYSDIDCLGIWKGRIPSDTERDFLANNGYGRRFSDLTTEIKQNLIAWWDFDEPFVTNSFDSTNIYYLTPFNTTVVASFSKIDETPATQRLIMGSIPAAWYDAADASTLTMTGSLVTGWADKSGNGFHLSQPTPANCPTLVTGGLNSQPVIRFNAASSQRLFLSATTPMLGGGQSVQRTIFVVYKHSSTANGNSLLAATGTVAYVSAEILTGSIRYAANSDANGLTTPIMATADTTTYRLLTISTHGNNGGSTTFPARSFLDGTVVTNNWTTTGGTKTLTSFSIGSRGTTSYLTGDVAEVIIFERQLQDLERRRIEGYLAWKWGLQGRLPADHPFKSAAPTGVL